MPDVPHASSGRSGLLSQTSQPGRGSAPSRCRSRAGTRSGGGPRGSSANCTICWISSLPPSSAGCALPAMTIWIGRSGSSSSRSQPLGVAQHQREPLVGRHPPGEADGEHVGVEDRRRSSRARPRRAPRCSQEARSRRRTSSTSRSRSCRRSSTGRVGELGRRPSKCRRRRGRPGRARCARAELDDLAARPTSGACTPLVTELIGTSAASKPGHRPSNIPRLTAPCSLQTPLARCASRRPMCAMLNMARVLLGAERAGSRSTGTPAAPLSPPKWRATRSRGKRSMPAGTGVWVVNTVPARTACSASSKPSPSARPARGCARGRGSRRGPRWCGTPPARGAGQRRTGAQRAHPADAEQHLLQQPVVLPPP